MRAEKGSAMSMIAAAADHTKAKNDRLKAAREARDTAEQAVAEAAPKPVKRKRKVATAHQSLRPKVPVRQQPLGTLNQRHRVTALFTCR